MIGAYQDGGTLLADGVEFSEALAYARGKAMEALKEDAAKLVIVSCGVELAGARWQWWYKLGWKRGPVS